MKEKKVQHRASRYFLGVGKRAPNRAVEGDIGWKLPFERQWLCIFRLWFRLINMDLNRLSSKIFRWSIMKASLNINNWSKRVLNFMKLNNLEYSDVDSGMCYHDVKKLLQVSLSTIAQNKWSEDVNRIDSKRGCGSNKLRTYRLFKNCIKPEEYVVSNVKKKYRRALALFRSGTAPINLELKRYGSVYVPVEERKCISCDEVESECHVIFKCPLYNDIRDSMLNDLRE